MKRVQSWPTEFDFAVLNDEIWRSRLVVNFRRFVEKFEKFLGIDERLVDRTVNITQHVERTIELNRYH